jgi:hypothetical protein
VPCYNQKPLNRTATLITKAKAPTLFIPFPMSLAGDKDDKVFEIQLSIYVSMQQRKILEKNMDGL